jgi:peroxiredoxin
MRFIYGLIIIAALSVCAFGQKTKSMAQTFTAADMAGETVDLGALRGKVVVMTFWSTNCAICASEIPKLNQMVETYRGKDVVFLGITTENPEKVQNYLRAKPFNFKIVPNSFGVLLKYADKDNTGNINFGFPTHFLINQSGEIELKTNGFDKTEALNKQINKLLMNNAVRVE